MNIVQCTQFGKKSVYGVEIDEKPVEGAGSGCQLFGLQKIIVSLFKNYTMKQLFPFGNYNTIFGSKHVDNKEKVTMTNIQKAFELINTFA